MDKEVKSLYFRLTKDNQDKFLVWATERFGMKATSIKNHWIYSMATPDNRVEEVKKKLNKLLKSQK